MSLQVPSIIPLLRQIATVSVHKQDTRSTAMLMQSRSLADDGNSLPLKIGCKLVRMGMRFFMVRRRAPWSCTSPSTRSWSSAVVDDGGVVHEVVELPRRVLAMSADVDWLRICKTQFASDQHSPKVIRLHHEPPSALSSQKLVKKHRTSGMAT